MADDKIYLAEKEDLDNHIANGNHPLIVTTAGTGEAYTATVEGMTELTVGALLVIIPHVISNSISATLDVNGLGAKQIRQVTSYASAAAVQPKSKGFLGKGKPVLLMYNGTYWLQATARANMLDAYGKLAIENGGTGADNAADALANLGAVPIVDARSADWDMDDVITSGEHFAWYNTNLNTLGTPYNKGASDYAGAMILSYGRNANMATQVAVLGGTKLMWRKQYNGTISDWGNFLTDGTNLSGTQRNLPYAANFSDFNEFCKSTYIKNADGMVSVNLYCKKSSNLVVGETIATLPVGCRPANTMSVPVYYRGEDATDALMYCEVSSTGAIRIYPLVSKLSNKQIITGCVTFLAAN